MGEPIVDDDEWVPNPDEVTMPEGRIHRRLSELIAAAAGRGLGDGWEVDSNLNWYPDDHGTAMAPDVMVLPTGVETIEDPDAGLSSYRQDKNGGPAPKAVVEIPSPSDTYISVLTKAHRYQRLGTVSYVVLPYPGTAQVERLAPGDAARVPWLEKACPELGGISFIMDGEQLAVRTHDGLVVPYGQRLAEVLEIARQQAEAARQQAESARQQAEARAEGLAAQLRAAGLTPAL